MNRRILLAVLVGLAPGCAAGSGTRSGDKSAREHHEAAKAHDMAAEQPRVSPGHCAGPTAASPNAAPLEICWSVRDASHDEYEKEMTRHRSLAAQHRAAARSLERAEAQACAGVSNDSRDVSPFFFSDDIVSTEAITESGTPRGAQFVFRPVAGLTEQSLRTLIRCHMARATALGHEMPEMPYCPLVLEGVSARVTRNTAGLVVEVTSPDAAVAREVERRARALGSLR